MVGRMFGAPFFDKYGKYVFLSPQRIDKLTVWFAKYGNKLLLVSYFVPGLRHFTGYVSGILKVRFGTFLLFSNLGAAVWVIIYVMAGRILGNQLELAFHLLGANAWIALTGLAVGIAIFILIKRHRSKLLKKKALLAAARSEISE
jgi:membrane protein DedA with SNARE-associated domain